MITTVIVIISALFSILAFRRKELMYRFDLSPHSLVHGRQYYRILTHAFLHIDYVHLAINMIVLYSFGVGVEQIFNSLQQQGIIFSGPFFYILLYLAGTILSSVTTITRHRNDEGYSAVGASGAVSAVVFTYIFFAPLSKLYLFFAIPIPGIIFGILYLVYSSYMSRSGRDNINHAAHFWGAVVGFLFPLILEPSLIRVFFENLTNR